MGWLVALIYVVCVALRLARFNVSSSEEPSWKDNFFVGIPSPAGGILVLMPLIYSLSEFQIFNPNYQILVPSLFIIISILLISKIPTYSLKKIVVPRNTTIFLLFSVILFFGLLFIYTFNTIVIAGTVYLLLVPVSAFHFYSILKSKKIEEIEDIIDDENQFDEDYLEENDEFINLFDVIDFFSSNNNYDIFEINSTYNVITKVKNPRLACILSLIHI